MKRIDLFIFFRSVKKHLSDSLFKVFGLSLGFASIILITQFVISELSYDRFHEKADQIYRVEMDYLNRDGNQTSGPMVAPLVADYILKDIPEINNVTRLFTYSWKEEALVESGDKRFYEKKLFLADPSFFKLFSFKLISGDPDSVFSDPNSVVVSQQCAKRYFGDQDPIGETIRIKNFGNIDLVIRGITENTPGNSHFSFDLILPISLGKDMYWKSFLDTWFGNSFYTYVMLDEDADPKEVAQTISETIARVKDPRLGEQNFRLVPMTRIHLHSHHTAEIETGGDIRHIIFAVLTAVIILLICLSNYVSITIAQIHFRAKEVGLKKLMGKSRVQLIFQMLIESLMFSLCSFFLALILIEFFSPYIFDQLGIQLTLDIHAKQVIFHVAAFSILFGIVAGIIPAFIYSSYNVTAILKSRLWQISRKVNFRKALVGLQFVILSALITISFFISRQHRFITGDHAGLDIDRIMVVPLKDHCSEKQLKAFKNELAKIPGIISISASSSLPLNTSGMLDVECEGHDESIRMVFLDLDADLPELYGMELVSGRFFNPDYASDQRNAYIINETAARMLGWSRAEGQSINYSNKGLRIAEFEKGKLIGIIKDFNHSPKHSSIKPLIMKIRNNPRFISLLYSGDQYKQIAHHTGQVFEQVFGTPLPEHFHAIDLHSRLYAGENKMNKVFAFSAFFSLVLACISIISLSKLEMKMKYREIGIRKIFGAGGVDLLKRYLLHYVLLMSISYIASIPFTMVFVKEWLSGFAYSIKIGPGIFVLAFILVTAASLLMIIWQVLYSVKMKPLQILRYE